jgi:hypothetical protein
MLWSNTGANELPHTQAKHLGFRQNNDGLSTVATLPELKFPVILFDRSTPSQDSALPPNRSRTSVAVCHIVIMSKPTLFM